MNPDMVKILAVTIVQIAQLGVVVYALGCARVFLLHYLDARTEPLPPLWPTRTAEEQAIDAARTEGREPGIAWCRGTNTPS